jgi:hypothetical protein
VATPPPKRPPPVAPIEEGEGVGLQFDASA